MLQSRLRSGLAAVLAASLIAFAAPAGAVNARLDPAYPETPLLGAAAAKGAVIWSHGRSIHTEDSLSPTPYYMASLQDAGWDTFRFNRMRDGDTLQDSSRTLVRYVRDLKDRGYRKVVLAGQSFGAFLSLMAADASDDVFAVVATAPAAYGSFSEFYDSWRNNATRLYPLLDQVRRARVMLFFFHGDEFDPGGRGDRSREILARRGLQHLVVDQPRALTGHWAASTGLFTRRYAQCIRAFIELERVGPDMSCEDTWGTRPSAQLPLPPGVQTVAAHGESQKKVWSPENAFLGKWYGFYPNGREVLLVVERVKGDEVTAIYALGPGLEPDQKAEWVRRTGQLSEDRMVFREPGRNTLKYRLRPDGRLAATWLAADGGASLEATLSRID
ncbi:MAG: alpha/beta hydrolase [Rhodospirillales bacterium]|nr:alpha/beta hydrolase [Rhodospirillales bacterium]